jgi:heterodisulfide reductase subunit C
MQIFQQILFLLITSAAVFLFTKNIKSIRRNIFLGKKLSLKGSWNNVFLLAFGQKKMFKNLPVAILHFFVYAGFIIINAEILEIILDGLLGTHRLFAPFLGSLYAILINCFEILALLVLVSVIIFLFRRNITKVQRLNTNDLIGSPRKDANIILYFEIALMSLFLIMNASDGVLQFRNLPHYPAVGNFAISQFLQPLFCNWDTTTLIILERACWWLHILGIFAFLNYLPSSKHLHIVLAFPNAYYAPLPNTTLGAISNMPAIQNEILYMMEPEKVPTDQPTEAVTRFGAKDIFDLSWKNNMDAYSCTECGRCSDACPANSTGKLLSPRKIMMATRDRLEDVGKNIDANKEWKDDGKTLLHDYISVEELRACTTCNACVEECPVSISPLDIIVELRRCLVMEESNSPQEWNAMFGNIENNMAPWKFSPDDRDAWVNN